jgi:hypothetical protein
VEASKDDARKVGDGSRDDWRNGWLGMDRAPLTLIVCGGRDFRNVSAVFHALFNLQEKRGIVKIKHGDCPTGADYFARRWGEMEGIEVQAFPADWTEHGKAAGPIRNQQMVDSGADGCVAFPGGRGTADMVRRAEAAGIKVWKPFG